MDKYIIYKHTNKINGKIYIGITKQEPNRRWQNGNGYKGTRFWQAIKKYGWENFEHEILVKGLTKTQACEKEKELISSYNSMNPECGYNISEGGQTGDNLVAKNGVLNNRARSVYRINPKTGEKKKYALIKDAEKDMGISHRGISKACRGLCKTYKGYIWEYADINYKKPVMYRRGEYPHLKQMKKIKMTDEDGKEYLFDSIKDASEFVGTKRANISRYVHGLRVDKKRKWELI